MTENDNAVYWLWLQRVLGPCNARFRELLQTFDYIEDIYAGRDSAEMAKLLTAAEFQRARTLHADDCLEALVACDRIGATMLCYADALYPERLRQTRVPPMVLFVTGDPQALKGPCVAGVGARHDTAYGREAVKKICEPLARCGITLVSGLAYGTDAEVHRAALRCGGRTAAVLGNGIDTTYPPENAELRRELERRGGCTVSEYEPGAREGRFMFPQRNRIVSGLSGAVVIFEAAKRSGTMITANWALEDGREVFAVPGNITSSQSEGTNHLLRLGAIPATSALDVLEAIGIEPLAEAFAEGGLAAAQPPALSAAGKKIVAALQKGGELGLDDLLDRTGLPAHELLSELTMLEIDGAVKNLAGARYKLK